MAKKTKTEDVLDPRELLERVMQKLQDHKPLTADEMDIAKLAMEDIFNAKPESPIGGLIEGGDPAEAAHALPQIQQFDLVRFTVPKPIGAAAIVYGHRAWLGDCVARYDQYHGIKRISQQNLRSQIEMLESRGNIGDAKRFIAITYPELPCRRVMQDGKIVRSKIDPETGAVVGRLLVHPVTGEEEAIAA